MAKRGRPKKPVPAELWEKICAEYDRGDTVKECSDRYGLTYSYIRRRLHKEGRTRPPGTKPGSRHVLTSDPALTEVTPPQSEPSSTGFYSFPIVSVGTVKSDNYPVDITPTPKVETVNKQPKKRRIMPRRES